jgi:molecular chaperone DnaJ
MGGGASRGARRSQRKGEDLRYDLRISLEQAFTGLSQTISFRRRGACKKCGGAGGEGRQTCPSCHGSGVINQRQGFFMAQSACPQCHGLGFTFERPCPDCEGSGLVYENKTLSVKIPAGVDDGSRLRLAGEGEAGMNGAPVGDLFVYIGVAGDGRFDRDGRDLYIRANVPFATAALGGVIEVPLVEGGKIDVKIPGGSQYGDRLRVKGRGMPSVGKADRGDLYLDVEIAVPTKLTARQEELLREFADSGGKKKFGIF